MKFIPDRIRKLFSKKSKKETAAPEAAAADTSAAPAPQSAPEPEPQQQPAPRNRVDELALFKEPEGYYLLNLDVTVPGRDSNGNYMHMLRNDDTGFLLALMSPQFLAGVKSVATEMEDHMAKDYGLDIGHVYYKRKDANFFFDGYDQILGLPPGDGFQLVLVPEGNDWKPQFAPPPMYAIPGTSTVYQHPATLLPQFQPVVQYPIIMVNGMELRNDLLPDLPVSPEPGAPKPQQETQGSPPQQFNAITMPAVTPPPPKEEEKPAVTATPAIAPPPPPKMQ